MNQKIVPAGSIIVNSFGSIPTVAEWAHKLGLEDMMTGIDTNRYMILTLGNFWPVRWCT